jgi:hypothetical protein
MMMEEVVYYTCLNNDCEKHRNIFVEGDPDHATCARERLFLQGQDEPRFPSWMWYAIPAALIGGIAAYIVISRVRASRAFHPPMLREETSSPQWSGSATQEDERRGNAVPPPMS